MGVCCTKEQWDQWDDFIVQELLKWTVPIRINVSSANLSLEDAHLEQGQDNVKISLYDFEVTNIKLHGTCGLEVSRPKAMQAMNCKVNEFFHQTGCALAVDHENLKASQEKPLYGEVGLMVHVDISNKSEKGKEAHCHVKVKDVKFEEADGVRDPNAEAPKLTEDGDLPKSKVVALINQTIDIEQVKAKLCSTLEHKINHNIKNVRHTREEGDAIDPVIESLEVIS